MEDELQLNITLQGDSTQQKQHLSWRERKQQRNQATGTRRQRPAGGQTGRQNSHTVPSVAAAAATGNKPQKQTLSPQQPNQPVQRAHGTQNGKNSVLLARQTQPDALHGYGAMLQGELSRPTAAKQPFGTRQEAVTKPVAVAAAARPAVAPHGAPKGPVSKSAKPEFDAAAAAGKQFGAADEDDIMALVRFNMTHEEQLQQDAAQNRHTHHKPEAVSGVVEFGDAPDEPDLQQLTHKAAIKQQHKDVDSSSNTSKKRKAQEQTANTAKQKKLAEHKVGELAHAEPNVPAAARQQLFGGSGSSSDGAAGDGIDNSSWSGLGLCAALADHLMALNFQEPTQVQCAAIPALLSGRDGLVRSPTGSGKTLAYLAPMVEDLQARSPRISRASGTHAVVLVPTRELAVQVSDVLTAVVRRFCWLVPGMLIGGEHRGHEKARLRKGVTVLVATPGRLLDHLQNTSSFKSNQLSWLVLDEADRLLDLGFEQKLKAIIEAFDTTATTAAADNGYAAATRQRQTVLLSATLHPGLYVLAGLSMRDPAGIGFDAQVVDGQLQLTVSNAAAAAVGSEPMAANGAAVAEQLTRFEMPQQLQQEYLEVHAKVRLVVLIGTLRSRLRRNRTSKLVVFFSNCDSVDFHHQLLQHQQPEAAAPEQLLGATPVLRLHGDMAQPERTSTLVTFSKAKSCVLLCTDVAARGLDFPGVTSIIQYDPAGDPAEYVHRVGRTARMGQQGEALLFLLPSELQYVQLLQECGANLKHGQSAAALQCLPSLTVADGPSTKLLHLARKTRKHGKDSSNRSQSNGGKEANGADLGLKGAALEQLPAAMLMQRQLVALVSGDAELSRLAHNAFRSFVRAYATHPTRLKHVFHIKSLHLGHLAASFGLREAPGMIGATGSAAACKKQKLEGQQAAKKREKAAWHKNARAAAALGS